MYVFIYTQTSLYGYSRYISVYIYNVHTDIHILIYIPIDFLDHFFSYTGLKLALPFSISLILARNVFAGPLCLYREGRKKVCVYRCKHILYTVSADCKP